MLELINQTVATYSVASPILYILIRASAIIIPPIPGIVIDLAGLVAFGWIWGFIYAETGVMLGSIVAFLVTRKFRERLLKRFVSLQKLHTWQDQLSDRQQFLGFLVLRIFTNPAFDYISYVAGLTKMSFATYFSSTLLGTAPVLFLIFYFGGLSLNRGVYYALGFISTLIVIGWIWKIRKAK